MKIWVKAFKGLTLFILCLQLATGGGLASDVPVAYQPAKQARAGERSYYPSRVRFGTSVSTEDRGIFYIDYLLPLFYSEDQNTLFFINPKQSWFTRHSSDELNIGGGIRHIFDDRFILGLHTFYDKKFSEKHKLYSQVGYGFEFLSEPFDFRFNYYDPHTKAKVVESSTTGYKFGSLSLIEIFSRTYEEPLEGFDFEFGCPVIPEQLNTRVYFGGFFFDSKMARDYEGFRARTETDLSNWLAIDITFNSWGKGETEFVGGLRVTIPLESGRLLSGKNPLKTAPRNSYIKERLFERVVRDIDVQARATPSVTETAPVGGATATAPEGSVEIIYVDDRNAGTEDGTLEYPYNTIDEALLDSRYVGQGGSAKYIYVYKGNSETTPYIGNYTLADDTTIWGSNTTLGYTGLSTYGLPVIDGSGIDRVFTLGNNNTIAGARITNGTDGIYAQNKTGATIRQSTISDNANHGIYIYNEDSEISDWNIENNTIENNSGEGIYVYNLSTAGNTATMSGFTFEGNTIQNNSNNGLYVYNYAYGTNDISDFIVRDNTIAGNSSNGIYIYNRTAADDSEADISDFTIEGNTLTDNSNYGIRFENQAANNNASADMSGFTLRDNEISGNTTTGIYISNRAGNTDANATISDFTIDGNTLTGATYAYSPGIRINNYAYNYGTAEISSEFNITGNTISNYQQDGIYIYNQTSWYGGVASYASLSGFTISGNTIEDNVSNGIYINNRNNAYNYGGTADITGFTIQDNDILNNEGSGIILYNQDGTIQNNIDILDNTIRYNDEYGIYLENSNGTFADFTLENNTIQDNGSSGTYDGIYLYTDNGADTFTFRDNTITGNTGSGINLQLQGGNVSGFTFDGNTIENNQGYYGSGGGIYIFNNGSTVSDFDFTGNTISNNTNSHGIHIYNYYGTVSYFTFSGNTIQNNGSNGIYIYNSYSWWYPAGTTISNFSFSGNTITGNSGDGVRFYDSNGNYIYNMDLGGGAMGSVGNNSIYNNGDGINYFDLNTNTADDDPSTPEVDPVSAQSNWWGVDEDPSTPPSQLNGNIDASDWLDSPP